MYIDQSTCESGTRLSSTWLHSSTESPMMCCLRFEFLGRPCPCCIDDAHGAFFTPVLRGHWDVASWIYAQWQWRCARACCQPVLVRPWPSRAHAGPWATGLRCPGRCGPGDRARHGTKVCTSACPAGISNSAVRAVVRAAAAAGGHGGGGPALGRYLDLLSPGRRQLDGWETGDRGMDRDVARVGVTGTGAGTRSLRGGTKVGLKGTDTG